MRTLCLLLLSCLGCFGQAFSFSDPTVASWGGTPAAGGGGGGSPGVFSSSANGFEASQNTISTTSVSGNTPNPLDVIYVDWYGSTTLAAVTNTSGACTFLTNGTWYDTSAHWSLYYYPNPPNSSRVTTAVFSGNQAEKTLHVITWTNASASAIFNTPVLTNSWISRYWTSSVPSSATETIFGASSEASTSGSHALGIGQTQNTFTNGGGSTHQALTWWKAGASGSVSNYLDWGDATGQGGVAVSIKAP